MQIQVNQVFGEEKHSPKTPLWSWERTPSEEGGFYVKVIANHHQNDHRNNRERLPEIYGDIADKEKLGPNPKGVAGSRILPTEKSTAPIQEEWPAFTRNGERLKVQA